MDQTTRDAKNPLVRQRPYQRVLIAEKPSSVVYHELDCAHVNRDRAAELARADAEDIGRRPAPCVQRLDEVAAVATDGGEP